MPGRPSDIPIRRRVRAKTMKESPHLKSKSLLRKLDLKSPDTNNFMQNLKDSNNKRGLSPSLKTSLGKVINHPGLLDYSRDSAEQRWTREVNPSLFESGKPNPLESFFLSGMDMQGALNADMSRAVGKVFFHSNLCLPVYIFRASSSRARVLLATALPGSPEPSPGGKANRDLLNLSFHTNSPLLEPNVPKKSVFRSIDLGRPKEDSPAKPVPPLKSNPSSDPLARLYFGTRLFELLQFSGRHSRKSSTSLKRFAVLCLETLGPEKSILLDQEIFSDALKIPRAPRVESHEAIALKKRFSESHRVQDTFFKRVLQFLVDKDLISLDPGPQAQLQKYLSDLTFNPLLNIFSNNSSTRKDPLGFLESVFVALNLNLRLFFESFFLYNLHDFMFLRRNIKFGFLSRFNLYSGVYLRHLNVSDHLFLQRTLLPFRTSAHRELRLAVCTWNIAGKNMRKNKNFLNQICRKVSRANPDVVVLGFQEIVEMKISWTNLKNIMFKCHEISLQIKGILDSALGETFICISGLNLMGILQLVYVHYRRYEDLVGVRFANWQEKFGGKAGFKMGNKGAVGCLLELRGFGVFSFANCHLTHGFDKVAKRVQKLTAIIERIESEFYQKQSRKRTSTLSPSPESHGCRTSTLYWAILICSLS